MADEDNGSIPDGENDSPPAPPAGWTPPATPEELNKIIAARVARVEKKYAGFDELKAKAAKADVLESANATDLEKAQKTARDEGRMDALKEVTPRLVRTAFRAEAKGVLSKDALDSLLEDVDLTRFITADGEVDEEKIGKKIAALAPPKADEEPKGSRFPDLGGGKRGGNSTPTNMNDVIRRAAGIGQH